jgi:Domain of unknown function (DUF222)
VQGTLRAAGGADLLSAVAGESNEQLMARLDEDFRQIASAQGRIVARLGEVARREAFRDDGATSTERWVTERFGVAISTARSLTHVGEKVSDVPHLTGALCEGEVSLDKVRVVADVATPETDQDLCHHARKCSVRELAEIARTTASVMESAEPARTPPRSGRDRCYVRFNDNFRTVTVQLPPESYAETKACLEAGAKKVPSDGETPWDQRLFEAFLQLIRSSVSGGQAKAATTGSPFLVRVHVPLDTLVEGSGEPTPLAGELERDGLTDGETVRRVACDATMAVAVDDDVRHTMYEGRAQRLPTGAQRREVGRRDRHCRFPGCTNVTFADVHHIVPWKPGGPHRSGQPRARVPISPFFGAQEWLGHDRERQRGAEHRRPYGSGHDIATFAALDEGHRPALIRSSVRRRIDEPAASGQGLVPEHLGMRDVS